MSNRVRRELRKLRELTWFLIQDHRCHFCKLPLAEPPPKYLPGHSDGPPCLLKVVLHHLDRDRKNPAARVVLCHSLCHKRHHVHEGKRQKPTPRKRTVRA